MGMRKTMTNKANPKDLAARILRERYLNVWPTILGPWTSYLIAARQQFDGDMDKMVVLAVIGLMTTAQYKQLAADGATTSYDDIMGPTFRAGLSRPINTESIAHYTGIPRETVRRKVLQLVERGWIEKDARGMLNATTKAARDLEGLGKQLFHLIEVIYEALDQQLSSGEES